MAKNIVILSDGTGKASADRAPTNVWRLYRALDLSDPSRQIAFYDDGVGTERLKPSRALGGAFGFGLKRNLLEMYKFLSRTYAPGDRVFVFGFSRGAYTVRTLVGLVHAAGRVTDPADEATLDARVRANYRKFREAFARLPRRLVGRPRRSETTEPADDTRIRFVGVWDTVDAYGLPIDEMANAWDYFIYPYRFPDRRLSSIVEQAAHALALDDERHTFHPVLWDERAAKGTPERGSVAPAERIRQVWFAGAHSNVGGGYPDDSLAHVPLDWMLSELEDAGGASPLIFLPGARAQLAGRADVNGKLYNSRSGVQSYYRFKPRNVFVACNDRVNGVRAKVRVHESVFRRIGDDALHYSPFGIPEDYEIVPARQGAAPQPFEDAGRKPVRAAAMERVWDLVYWRRWLYMAMVLATMTLIVSPLVLPWTEDGPCRAGCLCALDSILQRVSAFLPSWSAPWQEALGQNPAVLSALAAVILAQRSLSGRLRRVVKKRAGDAWRLSLARAQSRAGTRAAKPRWAEGTSSITRRLRTLCTGYCAAVRNAGLATVALLFMFAAALALANKLLFGAGAAFGLTCTPSADAITLGPDAGPVTVTLQVSNPCLATGVALVAGQRYHVSVDAAPGAGTAGGRGDGAGPWRDGAIAAGPQGYPSGAVGDALDWHERVALRLAVAVRRVWVEDWFVLMGQIGPNSLQPFAVGSDLRGFRAPATGELFVYVNDAVLGVPGLWASAYAWDVGANRGVARITVSPVRAAPQLP